jgi:hypothetical protein
MAANATADAVLHTGMTDARLTGRDRARQLRLPCLRRHGRPWLMTLVCALGLAGADVVLAAPRVHVTGRALDVNGQTEIPRGLFGVHADTRLTVERAQDWGIEAFRQIHFSPGANLVAADREGNLRAPFQDMAVVIDCQGDRYAPATVLTNPNYEEFFTRIGRAYAQKCKDLGWRGYAEFWNEPYLNWAERSRRNYDPKYYEVSLAEQDGPVTIKGWDKPLRYLRWRRLWAQDANGRIAHMVPVPKDAAPGDTFRHRLGYYFTDNREQTYTVVEKWDVYDPTQVSYWSGKQNYDFYMWMFLPWARAIKQTNPEVTVLGGWDFPIYTENWKAWEMLYRPMIDEAIEWLDGVTEHHYGSNTRANAASYEVAVGYARAEHGKWIKAYNTETAGCVDPAVPGHRHGNATPYGAYNYALRDIIELCYRSPDKAGARIAHGSLAPGWGGGGDEFLFKHLKDLRGRLVHAVSNDLNVWPVASINGDKLVVVIFNDRRSGQSIELVVDAPAGTTLGDGRQSWVEPLTPKGALRFQHKDLPADGRQFAGRVSIPQQSGVKLVFPLNGAPPAGVQLSRRQFFARGVLQNVAPERPAGFNIVLPAELPARAESAFVRVVLEGVNGGEATLRINDVSLAVPDHDWITDIPVDPAVLRADNALVFESGGDGYRVGVVSLLLDVPQTD